ncbi:MAG: CoA-transferase [Candidatus Bathyarchaeia archaeon]
MKGLPAYTTDELMIVCMAREVRDGDILAQGLTTPMAIVAYHLAKATHAPNATVMQLAGNILVHNVEPPRVSLLYNEFRAMERAVHVSAQTEVYETIFKRAGSIVEFFRPAQVDMFGNTNNSSIRRGDHMLRLPGGFGIPDASPLYPRCVYYCPRHERRVFVERVDYLGGLGIKVAEAAGERREIHIVSELGIFEVTPEDGRMRLVSIHPGVTVEKVEENTSFKVLMREKVQETRPPTDLELRLIREKIDPLATRRLEILTGEERMKALLELLEEEAAGLRQPL